MNSPNIFPHNVAETPTWEWPTASYSSKYCDNDGNILSDRIDWYGNVGILQKSIFNAVFMTSSGPRLIINVASVKTKAVVEFVRQVPQYGQDQHSPGINYILIHDPNFRPSFRPSVSDLSDESTLASVWKVPVQYMYESSQGIKIVIPPERCKPTPCYS
jgi:hypothetical protein